MSVTVTFTSHTQDCKNALERAVHKALTAIGMTAEKHAKDNIQNNHSVDTGRLLNSITHAEEDDAVYIGTNVEYAPFVELGTSRSKAKPYLRPAAEDHADEYAKLIESAMKSEGF